MTRPEVARRLRHALGGIVHVGEALEDGDHIYAYRLLEVEDDLRDLAGKLERSADRPERRAA